MSRAKGDWIYFFLLLLLLGARAEERENGKCGLIIDRIVLRIGPWTVRGIGWRVSRANGRDWPL